MTKKWYKVAHYGIGGTESAEFESEHRANSKKWLEQVKQIQTENNHCPYTYYYYVSKSGYLEERRINRH